MKIEIKHRFTGAVIFSVEAVSMREAVEAALAAGCNLIGADLTGADLRVCDLSGADLRGCDLRGCDLRVCNLTGCNLTYADLSGCDLSGADLSGCNLGDVPVVPDLHRRMEEVTRTEGALDMGDWHTCETTHCRAGWAIRLAGEAGTKLERKIGSAAAGALIYAASTGIVPDFCATDAAARADIEKCAKKAAR